MGFGDELSGVTFKWHSDSEWSGRLRERQVGMERAVRRLLSGCRGHSGGRDGGVDEVERWEATTALACPAGAVGTSLEPVLAMYQKPYWFCPNPRNFYLPNIVTILLFEASAPKEHRAPLLASHLSECLSGQSSTLWRCPGSWNPDITTAPPYPRIWLVTREWLGRKASHVSGAQEKFRITIWQISTTYNWTVEQIDCVCVCVCVCVCALSCV